MNRTVQRIRESVTDWRKQVKEAVAYNLLRRQTERYKIESEKKIANARQDIDLEKLQGKLNIRGTYNGAHGIGDEDPFNFEKIKNCYSIMLALALERNRGILLRRFEENMELERCKEKGKEPDSQEIYRLFLHMQKMVYEHLIHHLAKTEASTKELVSILEIGMLTDGELAKRLEPITPHWKVESKKEDMLDGIPWQRHNDRYYLAGAFIECILTDWLWENNRGEIEECHPDLKAQLVQMLGPHLYDAEWNTALFILSEAARGNGWHKVEREPSELATKFDLMDPRRDYFNFRARSQQKEEYYKKLEKDPDPQIQELAKQANRGLVNTQLIACSAMLGAFSGAGMGLAKGWVELSGDSVPKGKDAEKQLARLLMVKIPESHKAGVNAIETIGRYVSYLDQSIQKYIGQFVLAETCPQEIIEYAQKLLTAMLRVAELTEEHNASKYPAVVERAIKIFDGISGDVIMVLPEIARLGALTVPPECNNVIELAKYRKRSNGI